MQNIKKEKEHKNYSFSLVFLVALMGFTFYFIFRDQSLTEMIESAGSVNPLYLLAGFGMMFLYNLCETTQMYSVMKALDQKVGFFRCMGFVYIGFYFSAITPSSMGGQPMQLYYMKKNGINLSIASLVVLAYILIYQFVLLIYTIVMFLVKYQILVDVGISKITVFIIYGAVASVFMVSFVLLIIFSRATAERIVHILIRFLAKIRIIKNEQKLMDNIHTQIDEYVQCASYLRTHAGLVVKLILIMIVQFTAMFSISYFVYLAFGGGSYHFLDLLAVQCVVHLSAASIPLPGAVGASENNFYRLLQTIYTSALVFPALLLTRFINFYGFAIISGIGSLIMHIYTKKRVKKATEL